MGGRASSRAGSSPGGSPSQLFPAVNSETFREYCLSKKGATESTPFGEDNLVFKVGGKMFALLSLDEGPPRVNLKCDPDLALEFRDRYEDVRPGYHMNKRHWNTVVISSGVPEKELRKMIDHSYALVVSGLPRRQKISTGKNRRCS
jgi:predicted DNA-binding protein (MmcQ/YjbR family)